MNTFLFEMQFPNEGIILFKRPELTSYLCTRHHPHIHATSSNQSYGYKTGWPPLIRLCESSVQFCSLSGLRVHTELVSTAPHKI